MSTTSTAPAVGAARRGHHPGIALAVIVTCQMMLMIDNTVVNVAMPTISTDLHFSTTSLSWVMNAYALTFGGLLLLGGRSGDILGRRRVFIGGLALFTAASLLGGFATTDWWLLAARALQGVGAAAAAPTALSLITTNFPEGAERNRAIGLYGAVAGAGGGIGLVLGGMLVSWVSWRWVLFINVPIGIAVILLAPLFVHESARQPGRFDIAGALTSTLGVSALVYGFVRASEEGWSDGLTIGSFVAAVVLLAGFLLNESRAVQPITPLGLFRDRDRAGAYAARVPLLAGMMGMFYFLTLFVQDVMHFSPLATGFAFLPTTTAMLVMARLAPGMLRRLGTKAGISIGITLGLGGMVWLTQLHPGSGYATGVLGPILLFGFGMALPFIGLTVLSVSRVSATEAGAASGMVNVAQQVGGALGLAILVTVFGTAQRHAAAAPFSGSPTDHARTVLSDGISTAFVGASVSMGIALLVAVTVFTGRLIPRRTAAMPSPVPPVPTLRPAEEGATQEAPLAVATTTAADDAAREAGRNTPS